MKANNSVEFKIQAHPSDAEAIAAAMREEFPDATITFVDSDALVPEVVEALVPHGHPSLGMREQFIRWHIKGHVHRSPSPRSPIRVTRIRAEAQVEQIQQTKHETSNRSHSHRRSILPHRLPIRDMDSGLE